MDVYTCKPSKLFAGPTRYSVPAYQRGYVWDESQQWEPLWSDRTTLGKSEHEAPHFMGTLVLTILGKSRMRRLAVIGQEGETPRRT